MLKWQTRMESPKNIFHTLPFPYARPFHPPLTWHWSTFHQRPQHGRRPGDATPKTQSELCQWINKLTNCITCIHNNNINTQYNTVLVIEERDSRRPRIGHLDEVFLSLDFGLGSAHCGLSRTLPSSFMSQGKADCQWWQDSNDQSSEQTNQRNFKTQHERWDHSLSLLNAKGET